MNKKAGQRVLVFYWILIMVIIAVGIVSAVWNVFGANMDIREAEAGLLKERLVDCLVKEGKLLDSYEKLDSGSLDSLNQICKIDLKDNTGKYKETIQYGIIIGLRDINDNYYSDKSFGDWTLGVTFQEKGKHFPSWHRRSVFVLDNDKKAFLEIATFVDKNEKNT